MSAARKLAVTPAATSAPTGPSSAELLVEREVAARALATADATLAAAAAAAETALDGDDAAAIAAHVAHRRAARQREQLVQALGELDQRIVPALNAERRAEGEALAGDLRSEALNAAREAHDAAFMRVVDELERAIATKAAEASTLAAKAQRLGSLATPSQHLTFPVTPVAPRTLGVETDMHGTVSLQRFTTTWAIEQRLAKELGAARPGPRRDALQLVLAGLRHEGTTYQLAEAHQAVNRLQAQLEAARANPQPPTKK